uniref:Calpain_III domain-containing protein n=1 Tax=Macrostomum lignano TaxID=282301 RepID=A0A1I8FEN8_9PLAT
QEENEFLERAAGEKAYAKLNGSYQALGAGNQADHSMMGCCIEGASQQQSVLPNKLITATPLTNHLTFKMSLYARRKSPMPFPPWDRVGPAEKQTLGVDRRTNGNHDSGVEDFDERELSGVLERLRRESRQRVCRLKPRGNDESGDWRMGCQHQRGGCRNFIASFHTNPQFRVEIPAPDDHQAAAQGETKLGTIIVGLMQKRAGGGHFKSIGYCIYSLTSREAESGTLDQAVLPYAPIRGQINICGSARSLQSHRLPPGYYVNSYRHTFRRHLPTEKRKKGPSLYCEIFSKRSRTELKTMDTCSLHQLRTRETALALVAGRPVGELHVALVETAN